MILLSDQYAICYMHVGSNICTLFRGQIEPVKTVKSLSRTRQQCDAMDNANSLCQGSRKTGPGPGLPDKYRCAETREGEKTRQTDCPGAGSGNKVV